MAGATPAGELLALQDTLYASRNPTRRWLHAERRAWVEDALRRAGGRRVVEVGPGSGIYLPLLTSLFDEVTAVDVEEAFLARARSRNDSSTSTAVTSANRATSSGR